MDYSGVLYDYCWLQDGREGGGYKMVAWVEGVREMSRGKRLKVTEFSSQTHIF